MAQKMQHTRGKIVIDDDFQRIVPETILQRDQLCPLSPWALDPPKHKQAVGKSLNPKPSKSNLSSLNLNHNPQTLKPRLNPEP